MRNYKLHNKVFGALMLTLLAACGGNDDDLINYGITDPRYGGFASACGVAGFNPGAAPYKQTIRGQDGDIILDLLVYGDGSGNVQVVGEIFIPNLARVTHGYGAFRSCVSGQGFLATNQTDPDLQVTLQGQGIVMQPRSYYGGGIPPYVRGSVVKGQFDFQINGVQPMPGAFLFF